MSKRASQSLVDQIGTERGHLLALEASLRAAGDKELMQAVERARRELMNGAVSGAENTMGVNADAVRR